jgi:hypothetical protein
VKFAAYILSLYILVLSVVPCCAFDDCPQDKAGTEQTTGHKTGDDDCKVCSPFFNCEGCATAVVNFETTSFETINSVSPKVYTGFIASYIPIVHYDFWQPPKLEIYFA